MNNQDTGILINKKNLKLQRFYFKQAVRLLGIIVNYYAPREESKRYNGYGEFKSYFYDPFKTGIIFEEHPTVYTMRKLGWDTELQEGESLVHVPYDVPKLQTGGVIEIPSGIDDTEPRKFRILRMRTSLVYPSEIVCHIAPLFTSTFDATAYNHSDNNFSLLRDEDDENVEED